MFSLSFPLIEIPFKLEVNFNKGSVKSIAGNEPACGISTFTFKEP